MVIVYGYFKKMLLYVFFLSFIDVNKSYFEVSVFRNNLHMRALENRQPIIHTQTYMCACVCKISKARQVYEDNKNLYDSYMKKKGAVREELIITA